MTDRNVPMIPSLVTFGPPAEALVWSRSPMPPGPDRGGREGRQYP
jgi:hypothetical protein